MRPAKLCGRMYFVYLPTWERYRIPDLARQNRDAILSIVNQLRILIPDPLSLFPSRRYAHYNVDGAPIDEIRNCDPIGNGWWPARINLCESRMR